MLFFLSTFRVEEGLDDAEEDEYINTKYRRDNDAHAKNDHAKNDADDVDHDEDEDDDDVSVDAHDTFDLCDDDSADEFFASAAFNHAVDLLNDEPDLPRQPRRSVNEPTNNDNKKNPPPEKPDVSNMSAKDAETAIKAWRVDRKRWTDRRARLRRSERSNANGPGGRYSEFGRCWRRRTAGICRGGSVTMTMSIVGEVVGFVLGYLCR